MTCVLTSVSVIADIANIRHKTLKFGPELLAITGRGHLQMEARNCSDSLKKALGDQETMIYTLQGRPNVCPPAPALCGSLNASRLRLITDLNDVSEGLSYLLT